jgi:hypothetical protein
LHRLGKGFQELEEKRAEAKIAHRIVQIPLMESYDLQPLAPPNAGEPWYICRVTITYQDIFHRKHATIYDLAFRQRWQVVALIDDIRNDLDDLVG